MKILLLIPLVLFTGLSCSNQSKVEESDRRNLYLTEFFYEQGFPGKALQSAKQVKKSSPRYNEALDWIDRIESERIEPDFPE